MGCIYCARNTVNGKCYVGQTTNTLRYRTKGHVDAVRKGSRSAFHCAIRKYGIEFFEWSIIYDNLDEDDLDVFEMVVIRRFRTMVPNGYNLNAGGDRPKSTEETKKKLRFAANRQFESEEARYLCGSSMRGKEMSEESIKKISETMKGHPVSEETKEKIRAKAIGRGHTLETRKKLSEAAKNQKNRTLPPNPTGKKRSEETKRKMSEAQFMIAYFKKAKHREQYMPTCFI